MWYLWEEESLWVILTSTDRTVDDRVRADDRIAVGIVDFDPATGLVQHVGMRGTGEIVEHDPGRAIRLPSRYLGPDRDARDDERFGDPHDWGDEMVLLRVDPETVVARDQSYDVPSGSPGEALRPLPPTSSPAWTAGPADNADDRSLPTVPATAPLGHPRTKRRP